MSCRSLLPWLLALPVAGGLAKGPVPVPPRVVAWEDLCAAGLQPEWRLGEVLPQTGGVDGRPRTDLADMAEHLARLEVGRGNARVTLGDVLAEYAPLRHDAGATRRWLAETRARHASLFDQAGPELATLLDSSRVYAADWDPGWDAPDDGLVHADPLSLVTLQAAPWCHVQDAPRVQQVATLVLATPADILAVAHDFPGYRRHVSADYRAIAPHPGSHWRGLDDHGLPFAAVLLGIDCELPFPFDGYVADLWVLDQVQPDGDIATSIYSRSPDFHWMAGRDLLVPVLDSRGSTVATLAVRQQGFDLAGVPEDDDTRRAALRAGLGNLKRRAEARAAAADPAPAVPQPAGPQPLALPDFEVLTQG